MGDGRLMDEIAERLAARAAALLARPGCWLDEGDKTYLVRASPDRRRKPLLRIDEAAFHALVRAPGLRPLPAGGYALAPAPPRPSPPAPARPGVREGERAVVEGDGRVVMRRANLGESPIAWLASRRGPDGEPWLTPTEAAAGERLREEFQRAGIVGRLTMAWDAGPRTKGGRAAGVDPAERGVDAKARIARALSDVGPGLRDILEHVCLRGTALDAAERTLGIPRRSGKTVLKLALQRLAQHYRMA
ncbi:MAG TPA: DUF6456 domain-containing protein [Caulobacteraceae bacterium]